MASVYFGTVCQLGEWITPRGSNFSIFSVCLPFHWDVNSERKELSCRSKFFSLRVAPFVRAFSSKEGNRKSQKLFLVVKMMKKLRGVSIHLKCLNTGTNSMCLYL